MTGATAVIVYGSILKIPRDWLKARHTLLNELLSCSMCVGFWTGFGMSHFVNNDYITHVFMGLACSATSWLYDSLVGSTQSIEVFYSNKNK